MVEFGDDLIIESYKVPWLIWIQLLITFLLIILLFSGFSVFTSDPSSSSSAASPSTGGAASLTHLNNPSSSHRRTKLDVQRGRRDEETSGELIQEDGQNRDESSLKGSTIFRIFRRPNHPCNYFGLAKQALLKCLGLDSTSEHSSRHQHDKQE